MNLLDVFIKWLIANCETAELVMYAESALAHCGDDHPLEVALSRFLVLAADETPDQKGAA